VSDCWNLNCNELRFSYITVSDGVLSSCVRIVDSVYSQKRRTMGVYDPTPPAPGIVLGGEAIFEWLRSLEFIN